MIRDKSYPTPSDSSEESEPYVYLNNYSAAEMGDNPSVNLATGRLRYVFDDVTIGSGKCEITVKHVYNSLESSSLISQTTEMGTGWKLNLQQFLINDGYKVNGNDVIKYIDDVGEVHKFINFDGTRYYDENNAQTVLDYSTKIITDGANNRLYFDSNGRLVKSVTGDTKPTIKQFEYESDKLVKVYYTHTENTVANRYLVLEYTNNKLSSITVYNKANKKQFKLTYSYLSDTLASVTKVISGTSGKDALEIDLWQFNNGTNGKLKGIVNCQTKSAVEFEYDTNTYPRIKTVYIGTMVDNGVECGMVDAAGKSFVNCGAMYCGANSTSKFVSKHYKKYRYNMYEDTSYETDVTDDKDITIAYFINRKCCIVSSFEKNGNNLLTFKKQGAKRSCLFDSDIGTPKINGFCEKSVTGALNLDFNPWLDISRNKIEKDYRLFQYSFWFKTEKAFDRLQATVELVTIDDTLTMQRIFELDGTAAFAWQRVSIPIALFPLDIATNTKLTAVNIQFYTNGSKSTNRFYINEIGFEPAPFYSFALCAGDNYRNINTIKDVYVNGAKLVSDNKMSTDVYFAENDIMQSYVNSKARTYKDNQTTYFDMLCNNGTKRIGKVTDFYFTFDNSSDTANNNAAFHSSLIFPSVETSLETQYALTADCMTITSIAKKDSVEKSRTTMTVDYRGNVISEVDEYSMRTQYHYDDFGNLSKKELLNADNVVCSVLTFSYDADGKMLNTTNGLVKQDIQYNDYERPGKINTISYDSSTNQYTQPFTFVENKFGVSKDYIVQVREYDDEMTPIGRNDVTYQNGSIRTVTDGTVKYGIKYNSTTNTVEYTQFDGDNEILVQRDTILTDKAFVESHTSTFFDQQGNATDSVTTEVDKYGKINKVTDSSSTVAEYSYDSLTKDSFAATLSSRNDKASGVKTTYQYDYDGNLVSWEDTDTVSNKKMLKVHQVADNCTKYTYGDKEDYYVELQYDENKLMAPRAMGIRILYDKDGGDYNAEEQLDQTYTYDSQGRLQTKSQTAFDKTHYSNTSFKLKSTENYDYTNFGTNSLLQKTSFNCQSDVEDYINLVEHTESNLDSSYSYTSNGLLRAISKKITCCTKENSKIINSYSVESKSTFQYDTLHRLTSETNNAMGISRTYTYNNQGKLSSFVDWQKEKVEFTYDSKGKLSNTLKRIYDDDGAQVDQVVSAYTYDNYGNRTTKKTKGVETTYTYKKGGLLTKVGSNIEYNYNADNIRCSKTVNGVTTKFYLDGGKILAEEKNGQMEYFFYDESGVIGYSVNGFRYYFVKDVQGSIVMVVDARGNMLYRYEYDAWGNVKAFAPNGAEVPYRLPFMWKGHYYDNETGLYYANGSYYDPETGTYVDAAPISTAIDNAFTTRCLDTSGIMCDNTLELASSPFTVNTTAELHSDPTYEIKLPFLQRVANWLAGIHWVEKLLVGFVFLAAAIVLTVATKGTALAAIPLLLEVAAGVEAGIRVWLIKTLIAQEELTLDGFINVAADFFLFASIFAFVSSSVSAIKCAARGSAYPQAELENVANSKRVQDGVEIQNAQRGDFTAEAWDRIQSLPKRSDGSTISSLRDGYKIHQGYKVGQYGKEYIKTGVGRFDFLDFSCKTIYELKPNNVASITRGIAQLNRYNAGMGGGYSLILVLY